MDSLLTIHALEKYYGNESGHIIKAIDDIDLEVAKGEFIGIMGASGSGKSTLLNMIAAIDNPSAGHIYFDNEDISEMSDRQLADFRGKNIGFVFQDYNLIDSLTVFENISLALTVFDEPAEAIHNRITEIASLFGLNSILDSYPYEISGGQRQRCACARAVVKNPQIILADEPTGALDSKSAKMLMETLKKMNKELKCTILVVTHDAVTASYCDKVLMLQDGKLFNTIIRGEKSMRQFFNTLLDSLAIWGGGLNDVR